MLRTINRPMPRGAAEAVLRIRGMGCEHCLECVRDALLRLPGVLAAEVRLDGGARVTFKPKLVRLDDLLAAVASAGNEGGHTYLATGVVVEA